MGTVKSLLLGMCFVLGACTSQTSTVQTTEKGTQWEWQNGTIVVKTPERPAGQKSVLGLTTPKLEAVRVGFVGLGMRGPGAVERFTYIPGTQVVALCDYEEARAQGAYIHNLSPFWDHYWKNGENDKLGWRLDYNMKHRGDVYATHGLGPVAQALDIHRGDRMETLVAMDTKSVVGKELVEKRTGEECKEFRNGDHTTTMIRTANGKVIEIQHNVMTPQPYNRLYQLTGTKGFANKYPVEGYALDADQLSASGVQPKVDDLNSHGFLPETEMEALEEKYQHPILK